MVQNGKSNYLQANKYHQNYFISIPAPTPRRLPLGLDVELPSDIPRGTRILNASFYEYLGTINVYLEEQFLSSTQMFEDI